jgi:hypothetical protein
MRENEKIIPLFGSKLGGNGMEHSFLSKAHFLFLPKLGGIGENQSFHSFPIHSFSLFIPITFHSFPFSHNLRISLYSFRYKLPTKTLGGMEI